MDVVRYGVVKSGVSLFSLSGSGGCWWLGRVLDISLSGAECYVLFRMVAGRSWHSFIVIFPQRLINLSGRDKLDWFDRWVRVGESGFSE